MTRLGSALANKRHKSDVLHEETALRFGVTVQEEQHNPDAWIDEVEEAKAECRWGDEGGANIP